MMHASGYVSHSVSLCKVLGSEVTDGTQRVRPEKKISLLVLSTSDKKTPFIAFPCLNNDNPHDRMLS